MCAVVPKLFSAQEMQPRGRVVWDGVWQSCQSLNTFPGVATISMNSRSFCIAVRIFVFFAELLNQVSFVPFVTPTPKCILMKRIKQSANCSLYHPHWNQEGVVCEKGNLTSLNQHWTPIHRSVLIISELGVNLLATSILRQALLTLEVRIIRPWATE